MKSGQLVVGRHAGPRRPRAPGADQLPAVRWTHRRCPSSRARWPGSPATGSTYESHDLQSDLGDLLAWANDNAIAIAGLSARPASLEDVFMEIAATPAAATDKDRVEATR